MANIHDFRWHPLACTEWKMIDDPEYQDMKASIEKFGKNLVPIVYRVLRPGTDDEEKEFLDGRHRLKACLELGIEPRTERLIVPDEEIPALLWALNDGRRHEPEEIRRPRALRLARAGMSTRTIAAKLGVHQSTVVRDLQKGPAQEDEPGSSAELPDVLGRDGKAYDRGRVNGRAKVAPVKEGKELFDWQAWQSLLGQVLRGIDACWQACGGSNGKEEFAGLRKKFLGLDDGLRAAFNEHNGKKARAPARNRRNG